jgi:hypothetical protein
MLIMKRLIVAIAVLLAVAGCRGGSSKGSLSAVRVPNASASAAAAAQAKAAEARKQQQLKAFYAAVAKQQQLKAFYAAMAKKQQEEAQAAAAAQAAPAAKSQQQQQQTSTAECGERAVERGVFDPTCSEYQGYLDPGTSAGRGPTSGEIQEQYGCQQGYIPQSECQAQGYPGGG